MGGTPGTAGTRTRNLTKPNIPTRLNTHFPTPADRTVTTLAKIEANRRNGE